MLQVSDCHVKSASYAVVVAVQAAGLAAGLLPRRGKRAAVVW